jgi:hypothetical protein
MLMALVILCAARAGAVEVTDRPAERITLADGGIVSGRVVRVDVDGVALVTARGVEKHAWAELPGAVRESLEKERLLAVDERDYAGQQAAVAALAPPRVGAGDLARAYDRNELKADVKYRGAITVRGVVTAMSFTANRRPALMLDYEVCCVFVPGTATTLAELDPDDEVEISGMCVGLQRTIYSLERTMLVVNDCLTVTVIKSAARRHAERVAEDAAAEQARRNAEPPQKYRGARKYRLTMRDEAW